MCWRVECLVTTAVPGRVVWLLWLSAVRVWGLGSWGWMDGWHRTERRTKRRVSSLNRLLHVRCSTLQSHFNRTVTRYIPHHPLILQLTIERLGRKHDSPVLGRLHRAHWQPSNVVIDSASYTDTFGCGCSCMQQRWACLHLRCSAAHCAAFAARAAFEVPAALNTPSPPASPQLSYPQQQHPRAY